MFEDDNEEIDLTKLGLAPGETEKDRKEKPVKVDDPKALRNPRPDRGLDESRVLGSFNPVGQVGLGATGHVGVVTVITS